MRHIDLTQPAPEPSPRLARLTRHLAARLADFGPGGPQVVLCDQSRGFVAARFPGHETAQVLQGLAGFGVAAVQDGELARFWLRPDGRFEDLDYLWGCLFALL